MIAKRFPVRKSPTRSAAFFKVSNNNFNALPAKAKIVDKRLSPVIAL